MMVRQRVFVASIAAGSLALLAACASPPPRSDVAAAPIASTPMQGESGRVTSIEVIPVASRPRGRGPSSAPSSAASSATSFGSGTGKAVMTGVGAVGGAVAGNEVEKRNKKDDEVYRVFVRLDNGVTRSMDFHRIDDLKVGDRVRFDNGQLYRN
jgi:outer membrane lipoprotein SlyB